MEEGSIRSVILFIHIFCEQKWEKRKIRTGTDDLNFSFCSLSTNEE